LAEFDARGGGTAREARDWIAGLEIAQAPGAAAVQVMTIHKSKGLGFDVVVLPGLADRQVPDRGKFEMARGGTASSPWVLQPPAKWVRDLIPALQEAEGAWANEQRYEAMCLLYVALTRAKRGLYVLLPEEPASRKKEGGERFSSLVNWIRQSAGDDDGAFQSGQADWHRSVGSRERGEEQKAMKLPEGRMKRKRLIPSSVKSGFGGRGGTGRLVGQEVHGLFERIGWLQPGEIPKLPRTQAGALVEGVLRTVEGHRLFEEPECAVELFREQAFEVLLEGRWLSGVIDRMHVFRNGDGDAQRVEILDFKTDRVDSASELQERYRGQAEAYGRSMKAVLGCEDVSVKLVSTALETVVDLELEP
jgi:ATP-dependent exoDNAse (exonuclease V) beta subunit